MLDHSTPTEGARPRMTAGLDRNERPQQDSNLRTRLRRPMLYPLSYGGSVTQKCYQPGAALVTREQDTLRNRWPGAVRVLSRGGSLTECDAWFGAGARR
jgi:hypothetical protein